ncbi:hypothetical protein Dimus_032593 [Dionaea muscipula]
MGNYTKKGKITSDVATMEVGVRTRAKTLALQPNPELSYLQLRSRRLEKAQFQTPLTKQKPERQTQLRQSGSDCNSNPQRTMVSRVRVGSVNSGSVGSVSFSCCSKKNQEVRFVDSTSVVDATAGENEAAEEEELVDFGGICIEASFGENNFELDCAERSARESTPCSFIRDLDTVGTPGSAVRPSCHATAASRRSRNTMQRIIPTAFEMEEFFVNAELEQQKLFVERYNFDVVNDSPLPGHYEWVRVDP